MHGRVKVKTTEQQREEKRKERQKKLKLFQRANAAGFKKITAGDYDVEGMDVSKGILAANCDYTTMWNYRKNALIHFKNAKSNDELDALLKAELAFIESCLRNNPKSYGSWHQRCFVMLMMNEPDWNKELHLCDLFLQFDDRNFHCWDYRRFVVRNSNTSPEKEVAFTNTLIENNFSNYSSWHYRSKLLPKIYPDTKDNARIVEGKLLEELDLVQNAFFTDPNDQSAWFYHRWLLGRGETKQEIVSLRVTKDRLTVICTLRKPVKHATMTSVEVTADDEIQIGDWKAASETVYSHSWIFKPNVHRIPAYTSPRVTCTLDDVTVGCRVGPMDKTGTFAAEVGWGSFGECTSDAKRTLLQDQLTSCEELNELEPGNKWVMLTMILLMRAIDPSRYLSNMKEHLAALCSIDKKRTLYYQDLMSRYHVERALADTNPIADNVNLSGKNLTRFCHGQYLAHITEFDVSGNQLVALGQSFGLLVSLKILDASKNKINNITGVKTLKKLIVLDLRCNDISSVAAIYCLRECEELQMLHLIDNPLKSLPHDEVTNQFIFDVDLPH